MNVVSIPLDQIEVGDRLRRVDEDHARLISLSMAESGQHTPIQVRPNKVRGGRPWLLVAGGHRYRAAELAGLATLDAGVFEGNDLQAKLAEIDENLVRHELSALDRAVFLAERQTIYEKLYPQSRKQARLKQGDEIPRSANLAERAFTDDAAERLGWSPRLIQRAVKLARDIPADLRERISGTWLANNGAELDFLRRLDPTVQHKVIGLMEERGATTLKPLRDQVLGIRMPVPDADQAQTDALLKLWRRTGTAAKRAFARELAKDGPWTLTENV